MAGFHSFNGYGTYSMTKFAVRCFSDALRREIDKSDVRVSTVFPGGYRNTNFVEKQFNSSDKIWDQLEDNLKVTYGGNQYFQKWKNNHKCLHDFGLAEENWEAIEAMVDAGIKVNPKAWYQPIDGMLLKVLGQLLHYVPDYLMDKIDYLSFEK